MIVMKRRPVAGASVVVIGEALDMPSAITTLAGALLCLTLRVGGIWGVGAFRR
jgi:hypothetical protein